MRQRLLDRDVGPTFGETIDRVLFCNVESVLVGLIDFGEGFDQIDRICFVSAESGSNRMSVNRDAHDVVSGPPAVAGG